MKTEHIEVVDYDSKWVNDFNQIKGEIEEALKGEEVLLYIDYNNHYSFLDEQIKEIAKIQKVRLSIILCEPFSIENAKKINYIKEIEKISGVVSVITKGDSYEIKIESSDIVKDVFLGKEVFNDLP